MTDFWRQLAERLQPKTGQVTGDPHASGVGGGCINRAFRLQLGGDKFFVKLNVAGCSDMFAAEFSGLEEIARSQTVRVPEPIEHGVIADKSFLVIEWLELGGARDDQQFGKQLAAMHEVRADQHGWHRDNTIGRTPQSNEQHRDWITFFRTQRLEIQFQLAEKNGYTNLVNPGRELADKLQEFFNEYLPHPSLLHGDLWGGNASALADGTPVIFDPAIYYGDRETDLAMMELFGGFSKRCFDAYREVLPLDSGYEQRKVLYQLYHVLNHANLFGGGYARQAASIIERLVH